MTLGVGFFFQLHKLYQCDLIFLLHCILDIPSYF